MNSSHEESVRAVAVIMLFTSTTCSIFCIYSIFLIVCFLPFFFNPCDLTMLLSAQVQAELSAYQMPCAVVASSDSLHVFLFLLAEEKYA